VIEGFVQQLSDGDCPIMVSTRNLRIDHYEAVEGQSVKVVLANPLKMRAIAPAKIRNDKVDAWVLAFLLHGGLVAEGYVPPKEVRELRALVRHRMQLIRSATIIKNRVHSLLDGYGFRHRRFR
jgi:transposase